MDRRSRRRHHRVRQSGDRVAGGPRSVRRAARWSRLVGACQTPPEASSRVEARGLDPTHDGGQRGLGALSVAARPPLPRRARVQLDGGGGTRHRRPRARLHPSAAGIAGSASPAPAPAAEGNQRGPDRPHHLRDRADRHLPLRRARRGHGVQRSLRGADRLEPAKHHRAQRAHAAQRRDQPGDAALPRGGARHLRRSVHLGHRQQDRVRARDHGADVRGGCTTARPGGGDRGRRVGGRHHHAAANR